LFVLVDGQTEIRHARLALSVDEDVAGLQIAVYQAALVGIVDGFGYFG
jgi:hypothetical protein